MNYEELNTIINDRFGSPDKFAKVLGWSYAKLSKRLNGEKEFVQWEILEIIQLLELTDAQTREIFFPETLETMTAIPKGESHGVPLQTARRNAGIPAKAAARALGVSVQTLHKWETGETIPNMDHVNGLIKLYRVSLDELEFYDQVKWLSCLNGSLSVPDLNTLVFILGDIPQRSRETLLDALKDPKLYDIASI